MKKFASALLLLAAAIAFCACGQKAPERVVGAYVYESEKGIPDPGLVTHINFAFGHVSRTFDGVDVPDSAGLRKVCALKEKKPSLKVLLSIGGWGSGRFSEMAASDSLRAGFIAGCMRYVRDYGLDGIDIDWEYPTNGKGAGISESPDDTENFTKLIRELRSALGEDALLTFASVNSAEYVDFQEVLPYLDYVNVMAYDMGGKKDHHAALFRSRYAGSMTSEEAVQAHLDAGVPKEKLVLGMPFYGKGKEPYVNYDPGFSKRPEDTEIWDDEAKVPLYVDSTGAFMYGFENERSIAEKCRFIKEQGLLGGMYWEWNCEKGDHVLARTAWKELH